MKALRGINLGGWLVAERWMTPELFDGVSSHGERAIGLEIGSEAAAGRLKRHRDTFITEKDFKWIATHGFDFVRLPVGYWLFEDDGEGFVSGEEYVNKAFRWAETYGLGVILDFHGLQGSQNGYDHSGQVGKVRLYRSGNRVRALATMEGLAKRYGQKSPLIGIEVINEPKVRWFLWRLLRYYDKAFKIAERYCRSDVRIIVSDAFKPLRMAKALARRGYGYRLVLDVHLYQVFSRDDQPMSFDEHVAKVETEWKDLLCELERHVPTVLVGEWSAALPGQAYSGVPGGENARVADYYDAQRNVFDEASWAHCYWSYKAPGAGVWDYQSGIYPRVK